MLEVQWNDHLTIGVFRCETVAVLLIVRTDIAEIIYLAIGNQTERLVFIEERLVGRIDVDNAQAIVRESDGTFAVVRACIRSSMSQASLKFQQIFQGRLRVSGDNSGNSAHRAFSLLVFSAVRPHIPAIW